MSKATPAFNRKYYLHRSIKRFATPQPYKKRILLAEDRAGSITPRQKAYLDEIKSAYGYSVQISIPGGNLLIRHEINRKLTVKLEPDGPRIIKKGPEGQVKLTRQEGKALRDILINEYA